MINLLRRKEIERIISDAICDNCVIVPCKTLKGKIEKCKYCECAEAMRDAFKALEKVEKYKWHDLRKDPNDLPTTDKIVLCRQRFSFYFSKIDENKEWRNIYGEKMYTDIIAWKYIEPFEEEEE